jgi:AraC-like DNA-binding protein
MPKHPLAGHRILDHFLATLDIDVGNFTLCDIRDGWSVRFDACRTVSVHYCMAGSGALVVQGSGRISLSPHSFVLLPPGLSYQIESANSSPSNRVERARLAGWPETISTVKIGEGGDGIATACGELNFDAGARANPFGTLQRPLVVRFDGASDLRAQFLALLAECSQPGLGSRIMMEALLKQCLIMVLRRQIDNGDAELLWTAGVADQRLVRALEAIFERPASPFSVQRLADIAGMSRSAFAARFERAFGQPPMAMLKDVRLRKAAELLTTTTLSVSDVTTTVGFSSRSNFSQAFRKLHGIDPSAFRSRSKSTSRSTGSTRATAD